MKAPEITKPAGFINTEGITINEFRGKKVVLIDFWTYSCINCQRTLVYIEGWYQKYKDKGLVIVGIHTPEFDFEKEIENVKSAVKQFNVTYPVVLDNDYGTWHAFANSYWPRKYLIDTEGNIVYDHIGEGGYEETEKEIQKALRERAEKLGENIEIDDSILNPPNVEAVDLKQKMSPEVYFGSDRNLQLGNGESGQRGSQILKLPEGIKTNILYMTGEWDFQPEYAQSKSEKAKIVFRYQAKKVHMVASSVEGVKVKVTNDGEPTNTQDSSNGEVSVKEEKLYRLVENPEHGEYTLEIEVGPGFKAFTFTFG